MKAIFHLILVLMLISPLWIKAQTVAYSPAEIERMTMAYTFYQKQKISLEVVAKKYPSLKELSDNALKTWNREFFSAIKNIDSTLYVIQKDNWVKTKDAIINRYAQEDYTRVQETAARKYIQTVNERGYGQIETPVVETLLAWKPIYRKSPDKEMTEGFVKNFFVLEASKTFPINIKMIYPKSWNTRTVLRKPKFQQIFTSNYGLGNISMTLLVEPAKTEYQKDRVQMLLSKKEMQRFMTAGDIVLTYKPEQVIDNCPAASITIYHQEAVKNIFAINEYYSIYYSNYHIRVSFTFISTNNQEDVMAAYETHRALVKKVLGQFVILTQWGQ